MLRIRITFILLFFILSGISIFGLNMFNEMSKKSEELKISKLKDKTLIFNKLKKEVYDEQKNITEVLFLGMEKIADIENKIAKINKKTEEQKNQIREDIYSDLEDRFNDLKSVNLLDIQIIDNKNNIFLKLSNPKEFGQNINNTRMTIQYVSENLQNVDSFERTKTTDGLRFVYPLFDKQKNYIGAFDITYSPKIINERIMEKTVVSGSYYLKDNINNQKLLMELEKRENTKKPFSYLSNDGMTVQTVIPVVDKMLNEVYSYMVLRSKAETDTVSIETYKYMIVGFIILTIGLFLYIIYINITKKTELENIVEDKTNENLKQFEMLQGQSKMASMGEMIGSIAHQWRQPLSAISGNVQNLEYDFDDGLLKDRDYIVGFINKNEKIIEFMSKTIDDFRNFFRIDKEKIEFSIQKSVQSVLDIQSAQLSSYHIEVELKGEDFKVNGFKNEFQQVILNLINNSKDAMIDNKIENGKIEIEMNNNILNLTDNGGGIPKDVVKRVFEPYFTTKEEGKGTGMGLYMSKMIIEDNMEGSIQIHTGNGKTRFEIIF